MEFTETVLILRIGKFREADLWVKFFSPTRGLLTAFAFGGSRSRRRFGGCLDPLNLVRFRVKRNRRSTYLSLEEGVLEEMPTRLRTDWGRHKMAANCMRFVESIPVAPEGTEMTYRLLVDTVRHLNGEDEVPAVFPLLFRARFAFDQGFAPELDTCLTCGCRPEGGAPVRFFLEEGRIICADCLARGPGDSSGDGAGESGEAGTQDDAAGYDPGNGLAFSVSPVAVRTLAFVRDHSVAEWKFLRFSPQVLAECERLVDGFIQFHLGLEMDRGGFRTV